LIDYSDDPTLFQGVAGEDFLKILFRRAAVASFFNFTSSKLLFFFFGVGSVVVS
jgi:hypothetical protein